MNRVSPLCLVLVLPACVARPTAPPPPPATSAAAVLPGAGPAGAAWYDDRLRDDAEVVAGPAVAEDSASVTRIRGGLQTTASGEVRDTLDRRTTRETVRQAR